MKKIIKILCSSCLKENKISLGPDQTILGLTANLKCKHCKKQIDERR